MCIGKAINDFYRDSHSDDLLDILFRRFASLYFAVVIDKEESELAIYDLIHVRKWDWSGINTDIVYFVFE